MVSNYLQRLISCFLFSFHKMFALQGKHILVTRLNIASGTNLKTIRIVSTKSMAAVAVKCSHYRVRLFGFSFLFCFANCKHQINGGSNANLHELVSNGGSLVRNSLFPPLYSTLNRYQSCLWRQEIGEL